MKFEKISIRNFRNFENIEIAISNKNIFFGLNDIGKTNFLYAMRYVFDKDIRKNGFLDSDFHKKNVETPIEITVTVDISDTDDSDSQKLRAQLKGAILSQHTKVFIKLVAKYNVQELVAMPILYWGGSLDHLYEIKQRGYRYDIDYIFNVIYIDSYVDLHGLFKKNIATLIKSDDVADDDTLKHIQAAVDQLNTNISKVFMGDNFRSCRQIQNYSNLLCEETRGLYNPTESLDNIIWITPKQQEWPSEVLQYIDPQKRTALLRFRNADAENGASELSSAGNNFVFIPQLPIADITTETAWLYTAIAKYMVLPEYSVYDLISEIPAEGNSGRKSTATIKRALEAIANAENQTVFDATVNSLCDYLGYETRPEHLNKLFSTISNKKYHVAFNTDIYQNIAITFHSSKGLEFDQVILFAGDYNLSDTSGIYNHYVAVTRAKEKVVIVKCADYYANRFENNLSKIFALSGLKTCDLVTYK